ncbi:MAG TPA: acylphosphatase [Anaerolineales bacterium]
MTNGPAEIVRAHVWVKGRVQNVGFRAFVQDRGARLGISGWVRNVGNDMVEAVAEGPRAQVEQLIARMREGPRSAHVDDTRVEWEKASGEFKNFEADYSL